MNLKKVKVMDSGHRGTVKELEKIIKELPLVLPNSPSAKLEAQIGLGYVIYLRHYEGSYVNEVKIDGVTIERGSNSALLFRYKGRKFEFQYK